MANVSSSNGIGKRPKLQFRDANGQLFPAWKQYRFDMLYKPVSEKNDLSYGVESIISVANMYFKPDARISDPEYLRTYNIFKYGDIAFEGNKSKSYANGRFVENTIGDGIVSHVFIVLRPLSPTHNLEYWKYAINNENVMGRILARCTKKTTMMTNLVTSDFLEQEICCPVESEQDKIALFLSLIEKRLIAQEQLVEHLKKYKRGVVKTLLDPKQNQHQGVIWKTDTIGNLGTFIKGAALSKADISDSGNPFILYGELYTTYKEIVRTIVRTTQASVDDVYLSKVGDVVIPTSGETPEEISTASCIMVPNVILAGDLNIYRSTIVDGRIMSYLLNHIVNEQITRVAQGKSVVHVQASEIGKISITYPDYNEQERIAEILELIDNRIAISEMSLNSIQEIKKALLQQLFI